VSDPQAQALIDDLAALADPARAAGSLRFFQSGPGQYGEGDRFLGISSPILRKAVAPHRGLTAAAIDELLASEWHEHRLAALYVMTAQYAAGDAAARQALYQHYLRSTARINNWDLVDASAEFIVGPHLDVVGDDILDALAVSDLLWDRRIAIVAPFHRIKRGESATSLRIAEQLLGDRQPLIHKATGWMLREVGKRCSEAQLLAFLEAHAAAMTATTLSYACERLTSAQREHFRALRRAA
jgi:3-methyladenine DNA glycosylase AlkD